MRTRHDSADEGRRQLTILTVAISSSGQMIRLNMLTQVRSGAIDKVGHCPALSLIVSRLEVSSFRADCV